MNRVSCLNLVNTYKGGCRVKSITIIMETPTIVWKEKEYELAVSQVRFDENKFVVSLVEELSDEINEIKWACYNLLKMIDRKTIVVTPNTLCVVNFDDDDKALGYYFNDRKSQEELHLLDILRNSGREPTRHVDDILF